MVFAARTGLGAMATTFDAFEANTPLERLLNRVESGEQITITRNGQPVAVLLPVPPRDPATIRRALETLDGVRKSLSARGISVSRDDVRAWATDGRK